jgi:hypothetical protein
MEKNPHAEKSAQQGRSAKTDERKRESGWRTQPQNNADVEQSLSKDGEGQTGGHDSAE